MESICLNREFSLSLGFTLPLNMAEFRLDSDAHSGNNLASIPYAGPCYVQQPYYGSGAPHSPQRTVTFPPCLYYLSLNLSSLTVGYPHEQPTYYPSLQRGASSSSSLQHQAQGLGRMNTMASNVGGGGYDYAAQARAQSRQGNGGGGQYY